MTNDEPFRHSSFALLPLALPLRTRSHVFPRVAYRLLGVLHRLLDFLELSLGGRAALALDLLLGTGRARLEPAELGLDLGQLGVGAVFEVDHLVARALLGANQLVELEVNRPGVAV